MGTIDVSRASLRTRMDEQERPEVHNQEAWEVYMEAERREVRMRREGHLAKMLGAPLPDESPEELERLAAADVRRASEGLVELVDEGGETTYKHIDDLTPRDRTARIRAEGKRIDWITQRQARRPPPLGPVS
jgi:hypothetical protein